MMEPDLTIPLEGVSDDKYEYYERLYDPAWQDRLRGRRSQAKHVSKRSESEILAGLTDEMIDIELGFNPTYRPSRYEAGWLLSSLQPFFDEGLISDVLALVKGGKEASVYLCEGHKATGLGLLAAKVYRPRMFRNLRNDAMYRVGREVLVGEGKPAGSQAGTIARAIRNKTTFGLEAAHTSWLMHEFTAMDVLYQAGAAVPRPIAGGENAVLMSYHGDESMAAPTLNTVHLERSEAERLFREVLRNVDLMLSHDLIHGDLSAYNILYWADHGSAAEITLIDFPQVVNLRTNPKAHFILERDLARTCEYFERQGVEADAAALARELRWRYAAEPSAMEVAADLSRLEEESDD